MACSIVARASAETRVSEIILAVDEPISATRCTEMGHTGCRADRSKCLTHDLWEELGHQIHAFLSSVTLLDVLERTGDLSPLGMPAGRAGPCSARGRSRVVVDQARALQIGAVLGIHRGRSPETWLVGRAIAIRQFLVEARQWARPWKEVRHRAAWNGRLGGLFADFLEDGIFSARQQARHIGSLRIATIAAI